MMSTIAERATRWFENVEIHCSAHAELKPALRRAIKAAGGEYSAVRGYAYRRYVSMPVGDGVLVDRICTELKATTLIARGETNEMCAAVSNLQDIRNGNWFRRPTAAQVVYTPKGKGATLQGLVEHVERVMLPLADHAEKVIAEYKLARERAEKRERELHEAMRVAAAAPDLLAALKETARWMESLRASGDAGNWDWRPGDVYSNALAAIDKAEGR